MSRLTRSRVRQRDIDADWANSAGLPMLLVGAMILLTAMVLPDDVPFVHSVDPDAEITAISSPDADTDL